MKFLRNIFLILSFMFVSVPAFSFEPPPPPSDDDPLPAMAIDNSILILASLGILYAFYKHKIWHNTKK